MSTKSSNERIDPAAEARQHIDWAHEQQSQEGQFDETVQHNATLAVAEATLALVEQQRYANLISIAMWNSRALVEGARHVGDAPVDLATEVARVDAMFAEVKKGMGI